MSTYAATIRWTRTGDGDFAKGQYGRALFVVLNLFQDPFSGRAVRAQEWMLKQVQHDGSG
ncbi:MAG TPA: hypothetical protein VFK50_05470 [Sphingomicrobium sp.]|nr:hypothetical protein [Sphingomicrobium sp.]